MKHVMKILEELSRDFIQLQRVRHGFFHLMINILSWYFDRAHNNTSPPYRRSIQLANRSTTTNNNNNNIILKNMSDMTGKPIQCKAMVARAAKQPLVEETITVAPPKTGEVRVKVMCNALCHTGKSVMWR